jgi:hypothetical protein
MESIGSCMWFHNNANINKLSDDSTI